MTFVEIIGYISIILLSIVLADVSFLTIQQQSAHKKALARVAELRNSRRQMRRM